MIKCSFDDKVLRSNGEKFFGSFLSKKNRLLRLPLRPLDHLRQILRPDPLRKRVLNLRRRDLHVSLRRDFLSVHRQSEIDQPEIQPGDGADAGAAHGELAEHLCLGAVQGGVAYRRGLHIAEVAEQKGAGGGDLVGVGAEAGAVIGAGAGPVQAAVDVVDVAGFDPQVLVEARGESAAEQDVAEHEGVAVGAGDRRGDGFGEQHAVLQGAGVGDAVAGGWAGSDRRQVDHGCRAVGVPGAEAAGDDLAGGVGCDVTDDDDGGEVGAVGGLEVGGDVGGSQFFYGFRRGLPEGWVRRRDDRLVGGGAE